MKRRIISSTELTNIRDLDIGDEVMVKTHKYGWVRAEVGAFSHSGRTIWKDGKPAGSKIVPTIVIKGGSPYEDFDITQVRLIQKAKDN